MKFKKIKLISLNTCTSLSESDSKQYINFDFFLIFFFQLFILKIQVICIKKISQNFIF